MSRSITCAECRNGGNYNHCTCYLTGTFGVNPARGSMLANAWFNACNLSSPPTSSTNYILASSNHVAIRRGTTYYYHPGSPGAAPKTKAHSASFDPSWVGCTGTVRYLIA